MFKVLLVEVNVKTDDGLFVFSASRSSQVFICELRKEEKNFCWVVCEELG